MPQRYLGRKQVKTRRVDRRKSAKIEVKTKEGSPLPISRKEDGKGREKELIFYWGFFREAGGNTRRTAMTKERAGEGGRRRLKVKKEKDSRCHHIGGERKNF